MRLRTPPLAALSGRTANIAEVSPDDADADTRLGPAKSLQDSDLRKFTRMIENGMVVSTTKPGSINTGNYPGTRLEQCTTYRLLGYLVSPE